MNEQLKKALEDSRQTRSDIDEYRESMFKEMIIKEWKKKEAEKKIDCCDNKNKTSVTPLFDRYPP